MNRSDRANKAQETLDVFRAGYYSLDNSEIDCHSRYITDFITEGQLGVLTPPAGNLTPKYEVVNESVVDVVLRQGNCGVLNFASARRPGGGFLNGSVAQEECLTVSSDLYFSLLKAPQFYDINNRRGSALYTHNLIYSHDILFIRDGNLDFVHKPVHANVLTSPAVNATAYYKNEGGNRQTVFEVMTERIRNILELFSIKGDRTIILGAFGCGVFGNKPNDIAGLFYHLLKNSRLESNFEQIIFAVYDRDGEQYNIFEKMFTVG